MMVYGHAMSRSVSGKDQRLRVADFTCRSLISRPIVAGCVTNAAGSLISAPIFPNRDYFADVKESHSKREDSKSLNDVVHLIKKLKVSLFKKIILRNSVKLFINNYNRTEETIL